MKTVYEVRLSYKHPEKKYRVNESLVVVCNDVEQAIREAKKYFRFPEEMLISQVVLRTMYKQKVVIAE